MIHLTTMYFDSAEADCLTSHIKLSAVLSGFDCIGICLFEVDFLGFLFKYLDQC